MRILLFTLIWTAFASSAFATGSSLSTCASQVVNSPHERSALSDPREIVSFGAGTREEYEAQMEVARSLIGKRISLFWAHGPGFQFEPITVKSVSETYVFGEKGYNRRGVMLEYSYGSQGGFAASTSLWDLLLFHKHVEDWKSPEVLRTSPQIDMRGGIVSELDAHSQSELIREGLLPSAGEEVQLDGRAKHWRQALHAHVHIAQFFNLKTGALFEDNKLMESKEGEPVVLIAREDSAQNTEKTVMMLLEYWARQAIEKETKDLGHPGLDSTGLMPHFRGDLIFAENLLPGTSGETEISATQLNTGFGSSLDRSLEKHGGKLVVTSHAGFPRVEPAGHNTFKILIGPQTTRADLLMAWSEFIQKNRKP